MLILHETYDHWSVAVLTVTVHSSIFPTFDFFKKYVAFCTGFNLLTPIFMLPYIIMDLHIFEGNQAFTLTNQLMVESDRSTFAKGLLGRNNQTFTVARRPISFSS